MRYDVGIVIVDDHEIYEAVENVAKEKPAGTQLVAIKMPQACSAIVFIILQRNLVVDHLKVNKDLVFNSKLMNNIVNGQVVTQDDNVDGSLEMLVTFIDVVMVVLVVDIIPTV